MAGFYGAFYLSAAGQRVLQRPNRQRGTDGDGSGAGQWGHALYYVIPISAYLMGALISELVPNPIKHHLPLRWDTLLMAIEMVVVIGLGFVPESAPVQISQVAINFIASMQYNTFRQAEGVPMATTFATNHIRQIGIGLAKELKHRHSPGQIPPEEVVPALSDAGVFRAGGGDWHCVLQSDAGPGHLADADPPGGVFAALLHADLTTERDMVERKPAGH